MHVLLCTHCSFTNRKSRIMNMVLNHASLYINDQTGSPSIFCKNLNVKCCIFLSAIKVRSFNFNFKLGMIINSMAWSVGTSFKSANNCRLFPVLLWWKGQSETFDRTEFRVYDCYDKLILFKYTLTWLWQHHIHNAFYDWHVFN